MGSADLAALGRGLWKQAFFSARLTNAEAAAAFKALVDRYVAGGYNNDLGQLRVEARALLARLGYTPEAGFLDDMGQVPEAEAGSLQDLTSERRLNLIFDTNARLARGLTQKVQGLSRADAFPAWELARMYERRVPRGSETSKSQGWDARWLQVCTVEEKKVQHETGRMIALKSSPTWAALGARENFADALDVDHPPFAFNSGYGWKRELDREECVTLGLLRADERVVVSRSEEGEVRSEVKTLPKTLDTATRVALVKELNKGGQGFTVEQLRAAIRAKLAANGRRAA